MKNNLINVLYGYIYNEYGKAVGQYVEDSEAHYVSYRINRGRANRVDGSLTYFQKMVLPYGWHITEHSTTLEMYREV